MHSCSFRRFIRESVGHAGIEIIVELTVDLIGGSPPKDISASDGSSSAARALPDRWTVILVRI